MLACLTSLLLTDAIAGRTLPAVLALQAGNGVLRRRPYDDLVSEVHHDGGCGLGMKPDASAFNAIAASTSQAEFAANRRPMCQRSGLQVGDDVFGDGGRRCSASACSDGSGESVNRAW